LAEITPPLHLEVIRATESYFDQHQDGGTEAVGWSRECADTHYRVMLDLLKPSATPVTLLDFGCGLSHLYEYILRRQLTGIQYSGLDLSERFLAGSRQKFPAIPYYQVNVLDPASPPLPAFDYVVANGIFTYMGCVSYEEKFAYLKAVVRRLFDMATIGIAFDVMSKQVEWERDDLFHLPLDSLATFLSRELSRHFVIRHDYGLYEYTAYVYKEPTAPEQARAKRRLFEPAGDAS
jgi:SAM-dependent methyltransferase